MELMKRQYVKIIALFCFTSVGWAAINVASPSAVLYDMTTQRTLWSKNPNAQRPPASLTKLMTLYLAYEALEQGRLHRYDRVTISQHAATTDGSSANLKVGDRPSIDALLHGVVMLSGNDACVALAEAVDGSEKNFVVHMNRLAKRMMLHHTVFKDASGLNTPHTSAADLTQLTVHVLTRFPKEYAMFALKEWSYHGITYVNRNRLLGTTVVPGVVVDGIKTGYRQMAGFCLISSAIQDGHRLVAVVLGAPNDNARYNDSLRLLQHGFENFQIIQLYATHQMVGQALVRGGTSPTVPIILKQPLNVTVNADHPHTLHTILHVQPLMAPIDTQHAVGFLNVIIDQKPYQTYPVFAKHAMLKTSWIHRMLHH
jgi:serine-type D-Ala-D-Ala carboxypeptidase (penicillin-binding protein 5/6)